MAQEMLAKVRGLLDTAESLAAQGNEAGAATYRAKAEELMHKYRIAEEETLAKDPTSISPIYREVILLSGANTGSPFFQQYVNLYAVIARHCGVRVHFGWSYPGGGQRQIVGHTVGYEGDVDYAEALYTTARLVFGERLEPKVNTALSDQENVYRLRSAGMERVRVAELVWGNRDKGNLAKVGRMYKAECAARGETPALDGRGVTGKVYREQYANEFVWALSTRLHSARDAAGRMGGALVLHGRSERVAEAFYDRFPAYRPTPELPAGECEKCKTTKHESGKCKDCRPRNTTRADEAAWRRYNSAAAQRGREAGVSAARHVPLDRTGRESVEGDTTVPAPAWMLGK